MKRLLLAAAMVLGFAPSIASATTLYWKMSGADSGAGQITLGAADNGGYDITSFTGTIDGYAVSLLGGNPGWLPAPPNSGTPPGIPAAPAYSTDGLTYDNIFYMGNSPDIPCFGPVSTESKQYADAYGILFSINGEEGEIWGNGTHAPYIFGAPGLYTFEVASGIKTPADPSTDTPQVALVTHYDGAVVFSVPEPATWAMMTLGFAAVGGSLRAARRRSATAKA
jgi:hypothetical protein